MLSFLPIACLLEVSNTNLKPSQMEADTKTPLHCQLLLEKIPWFFLTLWKNTNLFLFLSAWPNYVFKLKKCTKYSRSIIWFTLQKLVSVWGSLRSFSRHYYVLHVNIFVNHFYLHNHTSSFNQGWVAQLLVHQWFYNLRRMDYMCICS